MRSLLLSVGAATLGNVLSPGMALLLGILIVGIYQWKR